MSEIVIALCSSLVLDARKIISYVNMLKILKLFSSEITYFIQGSN